MNRRDWLEETDRQHIELMIGRSLAALAPQCAKRTSLYIEELEPH